MSLPYQDASWVSDEITSAETFAELRRKPLREIINRYVGNWHDKSDRAVATPENLVFAWVKWMKAQIAFSEPMAVVKAHWQQAYETIARFMEKSLGKWAKVFPLGTEQDLVARDALFGFGVFKIGLEAAGDSTGTPALRSRRGLGSLRPFAIHKPLWDFGMDSRCDHWSKCRFLYDGYWRDLDDVQNTRGADPGAVDKIKSTYDPSGGDSGRAMPEGKTGERKQVRLIDVFFPEVGMVGTLASAGSRTRDVTKIWLRPPRAWYGPPTGPYVVIGFATAPDDPYPISPIQAVMEQLESMWRHQAGATVEIDGAKKFIAVDAANDTATEQLEKVPPNGIAKIKGLANHEVQQMEIGGVHVQRYEHIDRMRQAVQNMLSFSEAQQGVANAKTATSNSIAQTNADIGTEDMRQKMLMGMLAVLRSSGWYMFYDPNFSERLVVEKYTAGPTGFNLDRQMGTLYGGTEDRWIGGQFYPGQDLSWEEDFDVSIAPNSMQHQTDQAKQQDALTLFELAPRAYEMIAGYPGLNVRMLVNAVGESMNYRDLFDQLINPQVAQAAMQPPPPGETPPAQTGMLGPPQGFGNMLSAVPGGFGRGPGASASPGMVHAAGGFGQQPRFVGGTGQIGMNPRGPVARRTAPARRPLGAGGRSSPRSAPANRGGPAYGGGGP